MSTEDPHPTGLKEQAFRLNTRYMSGFQEQAKLHILTFHPW